MENSPSLATRLRAGRLRNIAGWIALGALVGGMSALPQQAMAQDTSAPVLIAASGLDPTPAPVPDRDSKQAKTSSEPGAGSKVGAAFKLSSLGLGFEVAGQVTKRSNLRGGFNAFFFSRGYDNNGIHYAGDLKWMSVEAHYDYFPIGAFHLSPGLLVYNDNHVTASASAAGGNSLTLNGVTYLSDPTNPLTGTGKVDFRKVAPTFTVGFGNLVPRNGKHFSFNIEAGVAFQGSPRVALALTGSACDPLGLVCSNVATDPTIQSNIQGQQTKISNDLSPFKFYPLVSLSFGYRF